MTNKFFLALLAYRVSCMYGSFVPEKQKGWNVLKIPGLDVGKVFAETRVGYLLNEMSLNWTHMRARFISAGTGAGKSTFLNHVISMARKEPKPKRVLILVNRAALKKATIIKLAKRLRMVSVAEKAFAQNSKIDNIDLGYVTVMTYQAMVRKVVETGFRNDLESGFGYVCFDEVHYFVSDSSFNEFTNDSLKLFVRTFHNAVRIYMTATDVEVLPYIAREERALMASKLADYDTEAFLATVNTQKLYSWLKKNYPYYGYSEYNCKTLAVESGKEPSHFYRYLIECEPEKVELWKETYYNPEFKPIIIDLDNPENNCSDIPEDFLQKRATWKKNPVEYLRFKRDFSRYELYIGHVDTVSEGRGKETKEKIVLAAKKILQAIPTEDKTVLFAETKELCEKIVEAIKDFRQGVAITRELIDDSNVAANRELQNIVTNEKFATQTLCATKYLDNGVNINDPQVKYVILLMTDVTDILQCLGRVRTHLYGENEKLRVIYLMLPEKFHKKRIEEYQEEVKQSLDSYLKMCRTAGEKIIAELPKDMFLSISVERVDEEENNQIEAAKVLGAAYSKTEQVLCTTGNQMVAELKYNTMSVAKKQNQLFMYEYLTGLPLTGDSFLVDPELPFPEDFDERYYDLICEIIPAPDIQPVEKLLEEQGQRLQDACEAEEMEKQAQDVEFRKFLLEQKNLLLKGTPEEKEGEKNYFVEEVKYRKCCMDIYQRGEENVALQEMYPELKKMKIAGTNSSGQTALTTLLNRTVMDENETIKIRSCKENKRHVTVQSTSVDENQEQEEPTVPPTQ